MMIVILLGAPGSGKGTQAVPIANHLGLPIIATGDLFRAAAREGTPVGIEARRYMDAGRLVPDDITIRPAPRPARQAGRRAGAPSSMASRARARRPRRSTGSRRGGGARPAGAAPSTCPSRTSCGGWPGGACARRTATRLNVTSNPPVVPGVCDIDGSPLIHREDDRRRPSAPGWRRRSRRSRRSSTTTESMACWSRSTASCPSTSVRAALIQALDAQGDAPPERMWSPRKSRAEIERMRVAGRVLAEAPPRIEDALVPGVTTAELDTDRRTLHPGRRR